MTGIVIERAWPLQTTRDDTPQVSCVNSYLHDRSLISGFTHSLSLSLSHTLSLTLTLSRSPSTSLYLLYCWQTYIVHTILWLDLCFYDEFCGAFFIVLNIIFEATHQGLKQD